MHYQNWTFLTLEPELCYQMRRSENETLSLGQDWIMRWFHFIYTPSIKVFKLYSLLTSALLAALMAALEWWELLPPCHPAQIHLPLRWDRCQKVHCVMSSSEILLKLSRGQVTFASAPLGQAYSSVGLGIVSLSVHALSGLHILSRTFSLSLFVPSLFPTQPLNFHPSIASSEMPRCPVRMWPQPPGSSHPTVLSWRFPASPARLCEDHGLCLFAYQHSPGQDHYMRIFWLSVC